MTLISVYKGTECVSRCDAKCHDASTLAHECDCCCGGRNHGVGHQQALENTREYAEEMMKRFINEKRIENARSETNQEIYQLQLF